MPEIPNDIEPLKALVKQLWERAEQLERDLRPSKVKLKVSGCFRTVEGAHTYARIQAAISTFRKRNQNVFTSLHRLFSCPLPMMAPGR